MNKTELVAAVAEKAELSKKDAEKALKAFRGVFGWFTGPITSFVGMIIPILLLKFGFNSNWDVLFIIFIFKLNPEKKYFY